MKRFFTLAWSVALTAALPVARAQDAAGNEPAQTAAKPVVFLDKTPAIIRYQLGRLSNEQLLLVDRDTSDAKFVPVYQAILTRSGIGTKQRQEALAALARLNKSGEPTELLAAINGLDAGQPAVLTELSRMLVSQKPEDLEKSRVALEEVAGAEGPEAPRRAAFAALAVVQPPDALWDFAQDKSGGPAQLLGGIPLVPDAARRAAYFGKAGPLVQPGGDEETRHAAIAAAAVMPGHEAEAFRSISDLVVSGIDVAECARALTALPKDKWPTDTLKPLADALLEHARQIPEDQRTENSFLDILQLGGDLAARLPKSVAPGVRRAFRGLGVNVIRLRTVHEQMLYDQALLVVEAGKPVELMFENTDVMPHNWVLVVPGALEEIGAAGDKMTPSPDDRGRSYVPASAKVLEATKLLNPGESERLRFTAPAKPDKYPYVCTFPGHWLRMRGTLLVLKDLEEYLSQEPAESAAPKFTEWKLADLAPDLPKVAAGRDIAKGKETFTKLGCVACHRFGSEGLAYGPDLTGVFAKYQGRAEAVLEEILDPSKTIEPRYRAHSFTRADGEDFAGLIVKEEADTLLVQIGPGEAAIQKFEKKDVTSRQPMPQSLMPPGLMNLLDREQILDLLAFLKSGADAHAGHEH